MTEQHDTDAIFLTFSAEEIGRIAVMIIKGVPRNEAIRTIPRYTREQHKEYAAFYDGLKDAIEMAWNGE